MNRPGIRPVDGKFKQVMGFTSDKTEPPRYVWLQLSCGHSKQFYQCKGSQENIPAKALCKQCR